MTANKPDKPGAYYWAWGKDATSGVAISVFSIPDDGTLNREEKLCAWEPIKGRFVSLEEFGGNWLGPVHPYGESWTIPEWDNWTSYLARLGLDPMFQLGDPKHGIKAFTKRKGKVTE